MKAIKYIGLVLFLIGLSIFTGTIFTGGFNLTSSELDSFIKNQNYKSEVIKEELSKAVVTSKELNIFDFSSRVRNAYKASNDHYDALIAKYDAEKNWDKKGEQYQYMLNGQSGKDKKRISTFAIFSEAEGNIEYSSPIEKELYE